MNGATEEAPLTAEELKALTFMRRQLGVDRIEQTLNQIVDRLNGAGGQVSSSINPVVNGHGQGYSPSPGPKSWKDALVSVMDLAGKALEKIDWKALTSGGNSLEAEYAARYKNLMDVAYGRYIPPGTLTPPVAPPP